MRLKNMQEDPSALYWRVDMHKNFKQQNMLVQYHESHYINLWGEKYFTEGKGWAHDSIP